MVSIDLSLLPDEVRALIATQAATIARQQTKIDGQQARIALLRAQLDTSKNLWLDCRLADSLG